VRVRVVKICELMVPSPCRCSGFECRPLAQFAICGMCRWTVGVGPDLDSPYVWVKTNRIRTCVTIPSTLVYLWESAPTEPMYFFFAQVSSKSRFRWLCQWRRWGRVQEDRGWVRRTNVFVLHLFISETNTSKVTSKEQLLYHCRLSNFVREGRQNWIEPSIWNNRNWSFDFWYFKAASMYDESNTYLCLEEEEFNQDSTELSVVQQK
jgi:hypothetical protein